MRVQPKLVLLSIVAAVNVFDYASAQSSITSHFVRGIFGKVPISNSLQPEDIRQSALDTLMSFLVSDFGALGAEDIRPATDEEVHVGDNGDLHIRYHHFLDGLIVEGAAMMIHINGSNREMYAVNGEYAESMSTQGMELTLDCAVAVNMALEELSITEGEFLSDCTEAAVYADDGYFHKAWKALIAYDQSDGSYQRSFVFASLATGKPLAVHPQIHGAGSFLTRDCRNTESCTKSVTKSSEKIDVQKKSVADAHNHAIDTYDFFYEFFGRDSFDNRGMTIVSNADFGYRYNNAFFDGTAVYYGSGDATKGFNPFSTCRDVVAHELSHGVTFYSSRLIYSKESGSLNEAMSDVMAAAIERLKGGKSIQDTWLIGEDLFTYDAAIRNMADPAERGGEDYYPTRYTGKDDNGGVHWNSGIVNLAFQLLVEGGIHPRGKTSVEVPAIDSSDFDYSILEASRIFYNANVACLTPGSNFRSARECTLTHSNGYYDNVAAAWDAVGVTSSTSKSGKFTPKQCLNLVKKNCSCALYTRAKSTCWRTTTTEECYPRLGEKANKVKFERGVHKGWNGLCKKNKKRNTNKNMKNMRMNRR